MTSLVAAVVLQASLMAPGEGSYGEAVRESLTTGRPLVVMLGANWCPACRKLRNSILPQVARNGALEGVAFAYVDVDQQSELTRRLAQGGSIPQLIRFEQKDGRWSSRHMIGAQSVKKVTTFITGEPEKLHAGLPFGLSSWTRLWQGE